MKERNFRWRLDLVRSALNWRGAAFVEAKVELMSLIAKSAYGIQPLEVHLYTDEVTWDRYYSRWLDQAGIAQEKLGELVRFHVITVCYQELCFRLEGFTPPKKWYFDQWLGGAETQVVQALAKSAIDSPYEPPEWLALHQHYPQDVISVISS